MRSLRVVSLLFAALVVAAGHGPARAVPPAAEFAVVRLPSHGASATVIETQAGRTVLLGCAHAFEGASRQRPIRLDVPVPGAGASKQAVVVLLAVDYRVDLSLMVLMDGPLPYVAPVAPPGHVPSSNIRSIGYDGMRWPARNEAATLLSFTAATTYTRERPGHGRSGGALLDADHGLLIGVVQGYEVTGQRRGMYVAHAAILRFLERQRPAPQLTLPQLNLPSGRLCPT